jgi:hypothetical protein
MTNTPQTVKVSNKKPTMMLGKEETGDKVAYQITLPRLYDSQQVVRQQARRYNMICCGRRWGKTTMAINLLAEILLKGQPVGWFAPNYKLLTEVWRDIIERFAPLQKRINTQDRRVEYITGGTLEFWSLENRRAARSRKYARVIIDEAAFCQDLDVMWRRSIRPTLTDLSGDAWFISTPDGRNAFYRMWQFAQDRPTWYTVQRSSWDNPYLPVADLEDLKQQLPERDYLQEILAQFISEDGSVFRNVNAAVTLDRPLSEPDPNCTYVFGVDWGRTNDATVCIVLDITNKQVVAIDRMVRTGFELQVGRLKMLYDKWRPTTIMAETNSLGMPLLEQMQRLGMPMRGFTTSNSTKAEVIEKLALAIEKGEIGLLDHPILIQELIAYTQEKTASGLYKYGAPEGEHDDCVMALAIAWHGVSSPGVTMLEWYRNRVGLLTG